jgi:hypothetical protein
MALSKTIETGFGVDAVYWNIFSLREDFKNGTNEVILSGYSSEENRLAKKDPIANKIILLEGDQYIEDATRVAIYTALKLREEFVNATDC